MSVEQKGTVIGTLFAGADLRALQFTYVKVNASGQVVAATTSGGKVLGILQNKPNTGEVAEVLVEGVSKAVAGAVVAAGSNVMSDAAGKSIVAATTGSTMTGVAFEAAAASGEIIAVYFNPCVGVV